MADGTALSRAVSGETINTTMSDMQTSLLIAQLLNLLLIGLGIGLPIAALWQLSGRRLSTGHTFAWAGLIVLVPILGALAFLIIRPKASRRG